MKVGGSILDRVLPKRGKIQLSLGLNDDFEGLILNLHNVYYLPNCPYNLVSLRLLNNSGIYYNNEHESLYQVGSRKTLAQAKHWKNSFLFNPLNLSNGAVHLLRVDADTYQPLHAFQTSNSLLLVLLSIWHKRLGHLNFSSLKSHLNQLDIKYEDDFYGYICDSDLWAKATKTYNRESQKWADRPDQFVYMDLIGPINPIGFWGKKYFFTFTDDATRMTETYTRAKKNDWLKYLKTYHSLCRTKSKESHLIERLRSDYESELQSHKVDE